MVSLEILRGGVAQVFLGEKKALEASFDAISSKDNSAAGAGVCVSKKVFKSKTPKAKKVSKQMQVNVLDVSDPPTTPGGNQGPNSPK